MCKLICSFTTTYRPTMVLPMYIVSKRNIKSVQRSIGRKFLSPHVFLCSCTAIRQLGANQGKKILGKTGWEGKVETDQRHQTALKEKKVAPRYTGCEGSDGKMGWVGAETPCLPFPRSVVSLWGTTHLLVSQSPISRSRVQLGGRKYQEGIEGWSGAVADFKYPWLGIQRLILIKNNNNNNNKTLMPRFCRIASCCQEV